MFGGLHLAHLISNCTAVQPIANMKARSWFGAKIAAKCSTCTRHHKCSSHVLLNCNMLEICSKQLRSSNPPSLDLALLESGGQIWKLTVIFLCFAMHRRNFEPSWNLFLSMRISFHRAAALTSLECKQSSGKYIPRCNTLCSHISGLLSHTEEFSDARHRPLLPRRVWMCDHSCSGKVDPCLHQHTG